MDDEGFSLAEDPSSSSYISSFYYDYVDDEMVEARKNSMATFEYEYNFAQGES